MKAAASLGADVGMVAACAALGVARSSWYRNQKPRTQNPPRTSHRALSDAERQSVVDTLNSPRFAERAPAEVFATLLDEKRYLCSISTMYRVLHANKQVKERRNQLKHPRYEKPELLATGPSELWSWDITKLKGPRTWSYFYLYVILDVFSRYVVGWMVAEKESAALAKRFIAETLGKEEGDPSKLTLHADRGSSMKSKLVANLLADLGVTKTHSRPHVSNDNPYSESQFKTMKYRPEFPKRFGSIQDAKAFCRPFFSWYNHEHKHHGLALLTPADVHHGRTEELLEQRQETLLAAHARHPERFARPPLVLRPKTKVWINPPKVEALASKGAPGETQGLSQPDALAFPPESPPQERPGSP